jgi:ribonucleotide monophosphatase NagD (HAD superfamily)
MKQGFLIDMDGVLYRGPELIPGADLFIRELIASPSGSPETRSGRQIRPR